MNSIQKMAVAMASVALFAGASAASAQSYGFTQAGQAVTASGVLVQFVNAPGVEETTCAVNIYGDVAADGQSIIFTSYDGTRISGGDLACDNSLDFPIVVTAPTASQINMDQFVVGTRASPCQENNYRLNYAGNVATFTGAWFGVPAPICRANGSMTLTTDAGGLPITIVQN